MKSGKLNILEPSGPLQACNGTALPLHLMWSLVRKPGVFYTVSRTGMEDSYSRGPLEISVLYLYPKVASRPL